MTSPPGTGGSAFSPGPLLSGPGGNNNDTFARSPTAGAIVVANSTPLWDRLLPPGIQYNVLQVRDASGNVPSWALLDGGNFGNVTANTVFAGLPAAGIGTPSFRSLVNADLPTVDVSHGGTGGTTFLAYGPIFAGTTPTGAFQSAGALGAAGTVLTSNGAGAIASFQATFISAVGLGLNVTTGTLTRTQEIITLTDAATIATNAALLPKDFGIARVTLTATRILGNPTNPSDGQRIQYEINNGAGGFNLTYEAKFIFSTTVPTPTLSGTAGTIDVILFCYNLSADKWRCMAVNLGFAS